MSMARLFHDYAVFVNACKDGNVAVVREMLALSGDRAVDVHDNDELAFR